MIEDVSKLLAGKIAKFTLEMLENKDINKNTQIIAISHVPPIMAFLGHVLASLEGKNLIDEGIKTKLFESFDGFVKPLEGFDIHISDTNSDRIEVSFPKNTINIPISLLHDLSK